MVLSSVEEEWRDIPGIPFYRVSNRGRVLSLERWVTAGKHGGMRFVKEREVHPYICKQTGYHQSVFYRKKLNIHRLMCLAFFGPGPYAISHVNHKNGIRSDNRLENLEWCTPAENVQHGFRENGRISPTKGRFGAEHNASKAVIATNLVDGSKTHYSAGMDAVRQGFNSAGISRACRGLISSHKGHRWEYADASH